MFRSGQFHIPEGSKSCAFVMRRELEYWGLSELDMEACCALKYYPQIEVCRFQKEKQMAETQKLQLEAQEMEYIFGRGRLAKLR